MKHGPTLRLVCVNDVYLLDNLPRLRTLVQRSREAPGVDMVLCTMAGDFVAPSLLSSLDHGAGMVDCLNAVPVTHACFGNHEEDVPIESLRARGRQEALEAEGHRTGGAHRQHPQPALAQGRHGPRTGPARLQPGPPTGEKKNALKAVLSRNLKEERIIVLDNLAVPSHKTQALEAILTKVGAEGKILLVDARDNRNLDLASRNHPGWKTVDALAVNVYDVVDRPYLVVSEQALARLVEVLGA